MIVFRRSETLQSLQNSC